jgi:2-dehydropantoate 2-reductase
MKIAVYGAGAVGGYFGGRLAQAGQEVTFIARGAHLDALLQNGLGVESLQGDFAIHPAKATDNPHAVGTVDLVLCCVKSWQVSAAADAMPPLLGTQTVVIPIQNGVEAHTTLARILGAERVLPGVCRLISMIEAPGRICHTGAVPYLAFGEVDGRSSRRAEAIEQALAAAPGFTVEISRSIIADLWKKFMLIAPWSGIGALTRSPIGVVRSIPETRDLLTGCMREVFAVARASKVDIAEDVVEGIIGFIDKLPPDGTASMQRDIMAGRPSELHEQSGAVVRFGAKAGVATPINRFVYHSLLPQEQSARRALSF